MECPALLAMTVETDRPLSKISGNQFGAKRRELPIEHRTSWFSQQVHKDTAAFTDDGH